jgi:type IV secretory pathway VirD2 relaxase
VVIADWDLDIEAAPGHALFAGAPDRRPAKLVYQATFSMPARTDAKRLFEAVREFARSQFGAGHRYLMALHTDKPHPHVHLVTKARSEQGDRLRISKATLRDWRSQLQACFVSKAYLLTRPNASCAA